MCLYICFYVEVICIACDVFSVEIMNADITKFLVVYILWLLMHCTNCCVHVATIFKNDSAVGCLLHKRGLYRVGLQRIDMCTT